MVRLLACSLILNLYIPSLFICKYKVGASGGVDELDIQRVFPIYGQFSVVMRQMGRGPVNLRSDTVPKSVLQQPGAGEPRATDQERSC